MGQIAGEPPEGVVVEVVQLELLTEDGVADAVESRGLVNCHGDSDHILVCVLGDQVGQLKEGGRGAVQPPVSVTVPVELLGGLHES